MKTSVTAAPSQSLNEALIVISEIEEKQSVASSKSEQCQKLQDNRPEHFESTKVIFLNRSLESNDLAYSAVSRKIVGKKHKNRCNNPEMYFG